jgi:hypothetical protein
MKKLSLMIPEIYLDGSAKIDPVELVLTEGYGFLKNSSSTSSFAGSDDELHLSFVDMDIKVLGALIQLRALATENRVDHSEFDVFDKALSSFEKLDLTTFVRLIMAATDVTSVGDYQAIELLIANFNDENELSSMQVLSLNDPKSSFEELNQLDKAMNMLKSA